MRLVLHVFGKDARRLRWPVAVAIGLTCAWVWAESWQSDASPGWVGAALQPLLALVWIYLVARAVQEEPLAGDRQYWLTRPYSRVGLVGAKVLFVAVFVHLPYGLGCMAIVWARGFEVWSGMGALWEQQAMVAALITLPSAAVAAVTPGFAHFCMGMFFISICGFASLAGGRPIGLPWMSPDAMRRLACAMLLGATGVSVLAMQYRMRRTLIVACIGAVAVVCTGALYAWTPMLYTEGFDCFWRGAGRELSLAWVAEVQPDPRAGNVWGSDMYAAPVELRGTGTGQTRYARTLDFALWGESGQRLKLGPATSAFVETRGDREDRFRLFLRNPAARRLRGERVTMRGMLRVDVADVHPAGVLELDAPSRAVPWVGRCRAVRQAEGSYWNRELLKVFCESPGQVPVLGKVVLRGSGDEVWEQRLGSASVHLSGFDWLSPLDRKQTFFPIVEERAPGDGNKWLVPREALQGARVELGAEQPVGCAMVPFEAAGRLDAIAQRFVVEVK